jgi:hypothetical protein
MNLRPPLLTTATLAAALCTTLAVCHRGGGGHEDLLAVARGIQSGEELDLRLETQRRGDEARFALADEVVAGRMSLREAADQLRRLEEAGLATPPVVPRPAGDERALRARVLDYVREVLVHQQQYAAAARYYAGAFAADPHLLAGPPPSHLYHAACAAAWAGCGQGRDAADLDEESRAGFRRQGLDWLRAELVSWLQLLGKGPENAWAVSCEMQYWLWDAHFAGVRGPEALARLPAAERQAWQQLWADVADTLARAEGLNPPGPNAGSRRPVPER